MFFGADELDKKINEELKKDFDAAKLFVSEDLIQRTMTAIKESNDSTPESVEIDENPIQNDSPTRENHDFTNVTKEEMDILFHKDLEPNKNKSNVIWIKKIGKIAAVFAVLLLCVKVVTVLPLGRSKNDASNSEQAELKMQTQSEEFSLDAAEDTEKRSSSTEAAEVTLEATSEAATDNSTMNSDATSSAAAGITEKVTEPESEDSILEEKNAVTFTAPNTDGQGIQSIEGTDEGAKVTFGAATGYESKELYQYSYEVEGQIDIINSINDLFNNAAKTPAEYTTDITFDKGLDLQVDAVKRILYYISENGNLAVLEYNDNALVSENYYQVDDAADLNEKLKQIIK